MSSQEILVLGVFLNPREQGTASHLLSKQALKLGKVSPFITESEGSVKCTPGTKKMLQIRCMGAERADTNPTRDRSIHVGKTISDITCQATISAAPLTALQIRIQ